MLVVIYSKAGNNFSLPPQTPPRKCQVVKQNLLTACE